eukprot:scaffold2202_cov136-Isochrysis_galbana.AAC.10
MGSSGRFRKSPHSNANECLNGSNPSRRISVRSGYERRNPSRSQASCTSPRLRADTSPLVSSASATAVSKTGPTLMP